MRLTHHVRGGDEAREEDNICDNGHRPDDRIAATVAEHRDIHEAGEDDGKACTEEPSRVVRYAVIVVEGKGDMKQAKGNDENTGDGVQHSH